MGISDGTDYVQLRTQSGTPALRLLGDKRASSVNYGGTINGATVPVGNGLGRFATSFYPTGYQNDSENGLESGNSVANPAGAPPTSLYIGNATGTKTGRSEFHFTRFWIYRNPRQGNNAKGPGDT